MNKKDYIILFIIIGAIFTYNPIRAKFIKTLNPEIDLCFYYTAYYSPPDNNLSMIQVTKDFSKSPFLIPTSERKKLILGQNYNFTFTKNEYGEDIIKRVNGKC